MIDFEKYPKAKIFRTHGVEFTRQMEHELIGSCPFTGKDNKFYVNSEKWLWDSKVAGMSGNIPQFLEHMQEDYQEALDEDQLKPLSRHRGLPPEAFTAWKMGWTGDRYTFPVRDITGKMVDIRLYHLGRKEMRSTSGCSVGLMGAERLAKFPAGAVYICEGEWDAIALQWLFRQLQIKDLVVSVPGAGTFKREWSPWFNGRRVTVLFDHDEPGRRGEKMLHERLASSTRSMAFVHWPDNLPDGFDIRDWIRYGIKKGTLALCWERLQFLFKKLPHATGHTEIKKGGRVIKLMAPLERAPKTTTRVTLQDVHEVYMKWLHLPNTDAIDVMLAVTLSQEMDGPPIWLFMVSPPGGAKTITLAGLTEYENVYSTSSLTSHSLISGANWQGQADPSLVPKLNGKVLVIKDFTSILGMRDADKEEIFGILRDAYDGRCGKIFGNGVERAYESRFTIVAAVTPSIYDLGHRHGALGERFLKFVMGDNLHHEAEDDIISRAITNVDQDSTIRTELAEVTAAYLSRMHAELVPAKLNNLYHNRVIALAQLGARLRGTVSREVYNTEMMTGKPFAEVGSRLGIQLSKMARALATVRGQQDVSEPEYTIVKKVMIDTVSQRSEDLVRVIHDFGKPMTTQEITTATRYPMTTIRRVLEDLNLLKVVRRRGSAGQGFRQTWELTPYIVRCITDSQVYRNPPPVRLVLKRRRVE